MAFSSSSSLLFETIQELAFSCVPVAGEIGEQGVIKIKATISVNDNVF